jgi:RNA 3'-terminal phosphate cyclase (ATP)
VAHDLAREAPPPGSWAALGPYLADQWALPLALAVWRSGRGASYTCTELTPHARSNFEVIERFVPVRFATDATATAGVFASPA